VVVSALVRLHVARLALVVAALDEVGRIRETLAQDWSRCGGHKPSAAEDWHSEGFGDAEVIAWLEAGVPFVGNAKMLDEVGITPSDVRREHFDGVTLGLAFARGDVTLAKVQRIVNGPEVG